MPAVMPAPRMRRSDRQLLKPSYYILCMITSLVLAQDKPSGHIGRGAKAVILLHQDIRDARESVACPLDLTQLPELNVRLLSSLEEEIEQIQLIRSGVDGSGVDVRVILSRGNLSDAVACCIRESTSTCFTILGAAGCWFVSRPFSGNECEAIN
jgi:hypothetical protein